MHYYNNTAGAGAGTEYSGQSSNAVSGSRLWIQNPQSVRILAAAADAAQQPPAMLAEVWFLSKVCTPPVLQALLKTSGNITACGKPAIIIIIIIITNLRRLVTLAEHTSDHGKYH